MIMHFLYDTRTGRRLLKVLMNTGGLKLVAAFLKTRLSRIIIKPYIKRNHIDMSEFKGQKYGSFADFFARKRPDHVIHSNEEELISPCDGLLSIYPIDNEVEIPMKGSLYRLNDLIPKEKYVPLFSGGLCLIFRLEASDYHHFCCFDDGVICGTQYIEGILHSVQPIAQKRYPVYHLNRRWWTLLDTKNFGYVSQIEVGALAVGGVKHRKKEGYCRRGEEMGNFKLCGSTIILILPTEARMALHFHNRFEKSWNGEQEIRVRMGENIGNLW